jgi:hypothetical protein
VKKEFFKMLLKVKFSEFKVKSFSNFPFLKVFLSSICCAVAFGQFNQPFNPTPFFPNRALTPPRAITTLNTYVPRRLIPSAPPRQNIPPRVYENSQRVYTAPPVFRAIQPAPTTRRTFVSNTNNNPRYAFNYGVNDNRVNRNTSNYRLLPGNFLILQVHPLVLPHAPLFVTE